MDSIGSEVHKLPLSFRTEGTDGGKMVASLQSECHSCGMSSPASTRHEPGNRYDSDAHATVDSQSSNVTEPGDATPATSRTPDINMCRCTHANTDKTPSRPTAPHGTPYVVGLPATYHKMHTYVTCPACANSPMAGPSTSKAQSVILHGHETRTFQKQAPSSADASIPPPILMRTGQTPIEVIEPPLHGVDGGSSAPLLPFSRRNAFPDPWSSEVAHTFSWSVRLGALADTLDRLEQPLLDIPNTTHE